MNAKSITAFKDTDVVYLLAGVSVVLPLVAVLLLYLFRRRCCRARIQSRPRRIPNSSSFQEHNRISMYVGDPENDHLEVFANDGCKEEETNEKETEKPTEAKDDPQVEMSEVDSSMTNHSSESMSQHGTSSTMLPHCIIENKSQVNEAYESEDEDMRKNGDVAHEKNGVLVGILKSEFLDIDSTPTQDALQNKEEECDDASTAETVEALSLMEDAVNHCEEETASVTPSDSERSTSEEPEYNILVTSHEDAVTSSDSEVEMYVNIQTRQEGVKHKSDEDTDTQSGSELLDCTTDSSTTLTVNETHLEATDEVNIEVAESQSLYENVVLGVKSQVEAIEDEDDQEVQPGISLVSNVENPYEVQDEVPQRSKPDLQCKVEKESCSENQLKDSAENTVEIQAETVCEVEGIPQREESTESITIMEEEGTKSPIIDFTEIEEDISQYSNDPCPTVGSSLTKEEHDEDVNSPLTNSPVAAPEVEYVSMNVETESPYEVASADDIGPPPVEAGTDDQLGDYDIPKSLISANDATEVVSNEINHYDYVPIRNSSDNVEEQAIGEHNLQNMAKDDTVNSPAVAPAGEYVSMTEDIESPYEVASVDDDGRPKASAVEASTPDQLYDIPKRLISPNDAAETASEKIDHYENVPTVKSSSSVGAQQNVRKRINEDMIRSKSTDAYHLSENQHLKHMTYVNTPWRSLDGDAGTSDTSGDVKENNVAETFVQKPYNESDTTTENDYVPMDINAIRNIIRTIPPQSPESIAPGITKTSEGGDDVTQDMKDVSICTPRPPSVHSLTSDDEKDGNYVNVTKELSQKLQKSVTESVTQNQENQVNPHQSIITKLAQKVTPIANESLDDASVETELKPAESPPEATLHGVMKPQESLLEDYTPMHSYGGLDAQISCEEDYEVMNTKPVDEVRQKTPPPTKEKPTEQKGAISGGSSKPRGTRLTVEECTSPTATSLVSHFESLIKNKK